MVAATELLDAKPSFANPVSCATRLDAYCSWSAASGTGFTGVGESITFGVANTAASENLELNAVTVAAVPEPTTYRMMLTGLLMVGMLAFVRRRSAR